MKRPLILHITNNLRVVKAYLIFKYMLLTITTPILLSLYLRAHMITNGSIAPLVPYLVFIFIFWLLDKVVQSLFVIRYEENEEHEQHTNTNRFKTIANVIPITKARKLQEQIKQDNNSTNKNDTGGRCGNSSGK
ncbi:hypothetical protein VCSRO121_3480 [Vibrio cholerae]|nr:hypothetical protein VCSRO121_3480 [Vibrio cholerae]